MRAFSPSLALRLAALLALAVAPAAAKPVSPDEAELRQAAASLPAALAAAKQAGVPMAPADIRPAHPVPKEKNAAPVYRQIERESDRLSKADQDRLSGLARLLTAKEPDVPAVRDDMAHLAGLLALAERATSIPEFDAQLRWNKLAESGAVSVLGPSLDTWTGMRTAARLLAAQALLEGEEGRWEDAFRHLQAAAQVARHLTEEPTIMGLAMHNAVALNADRAFKQILRRHGDEPAVLQRAKQVHEAISGTADVRHALRGEALFVLLQPSGLRKDDELLEDDAQREASRRLARYPASLVRDAFRARTLDLFRRLILALDGAGPDPLAIHRKLQPILDAEAARKGPSYRESAWMAGVWSRAALMGALPIARQRLRQAFITLLETRSRTGAFPEQLPNAPADPFDGRPLRYRKTEAGFLLYSIGLNLKDDGGKDRREAEDADDVVIQYP